ncbi:MAG: phosphodiester glycosidase family protein [Chitinispirillaceae bacterium]|nr:phosphodiester glycosidase family protein [Chitinispirillaceae bacterium]
MIRPEKATPAFHVQGEVVQQDSLLTVKIVLIDNNDRVISSGFISGTDSFFRTIRDVTGETVFYVLDVDQTSLKFPTTRKRPTLSGSAYALYLKARQKATAGQYDRAISLMHAAIERDSWFTSAYTVTAQLYREKGIDDSAALWEQMVKESNGVLPYRDSVNKEQPLKDLLDESGVQPFISVEKGLHYKHISLPEHDLSALVWLLDLNHFAITLKMQSSAAGNYIHEFMTSPRAILAINGGFFEIGRNYVHTPSGLIVTNGRLLNPLTDYGGTGIFCIKEGMPQIVWAKESINPAGCTLALQCGPVIVEPGGVMGVYDNSYRRLSRSAIGLADGKVVLAIVSGKGGSGLSLYEFAEFLRRKREEGGIGCDAALNLDGGASSQVCFSHKKLAVAVNGLWKINSAIVVEKR